MGNHAGSNETQGLADLIPLAYGELRRVAQQRMTQLAPGSTLSPCNLVQEVLVRFLKQPERTPLKGPDDLVRAAAMAMHNVLVDLARRRSAAGHAALRRPGDLDGDLPIAAPVEDMLGFQEACELLRRRSEQHFELVLLRIYANLTIEEIAAQRGQTTRTVEHHWRFAKAVLGARLKQNAAGSRSTRWEEAFNA